MAKGSRITRTVRMFVILGGLWLVGSTATSWWQAAAENPINAIQLLFYFCAFVEAMCWTVAMILPSRSHGGPFTESKRLMTAELPQSPEEVETCARHEAMHAVAALHFGVEINEVVIRRDGGRGGYTNYRLMEDLDPTSRHWAQAIIGLAPAGNNDGSSQTDDSHAFSHIIQVLGIGVRPTGYHGPWDMTSLMTTALRTAKLIVDQQAAAVERITAALIEKRCLTGAEIAALAKRS